LTIIIIIIDIINEILLIMTLSSQHET